MSSLVILAKFLLFHKHKVEAGKAVASTECDNANRVKSKLEEFERSRKAGRAGQSPST